MSNLRMLLQNQQPQYLWLLNEPGPRILLEALNLYGTKETAGEANSPVILGWAKEIGGWIGDWYKLDSVPWCGLFVALVARRAGFPFGQKALSAKEWLGWGIPRAQPELGDVVVFQRPGGGHVGIYVGEDASAYHILGGNQGDMVNVTRLAKARMVGARHCPWTKVEPNNVRRVILKGQGALSEDEA